MEVFNISRIVTAEGIFRISGEISMPESRSKDNNSITITSLDIMSTDGWQALDTSTEHVKKLIRSLHSAILCHLE